ncbi:hypothetical protein SS7213T_03875 [Staphylococcus simiae CCM 7213 = CCUG 51256]|uniref:Uncharacterized protein n=1 Tax=Staphylococcus simiae CCM 7213 = CCUG 51256 TaxID=911238 RepID=G5JH46_9STAP|nr:hypothetical protein SS7213T_03875 [Staphylococcus simiae CCM 7213 = CCUG 51256]
MNATILANAPTAIAVVKYKNGSSTIVSTVKINVAIR